MIEYIGKKRSAEEILRETQAELTWENLRISVELITPEIASELLEEKAPNRRVSDRHVGKLVRDMLGNRWFVTQQGIGLNEHEELIDGQHRLWAIVESGAPQHMLVVRGIPQEAMHAMDETKKRTFSDDLTMRGEVDTFSKAGIVHLIARAEYAWEKGLGYQTVQQSGRFNRYELDEKLDEINQVADILEINQQAHALKGARSIPASAGGAFVYLTTKFGYEDEAREFFERLREQLGFYRGDPVKTLSDKVKNMQETRPKPDGAEYLLWMILAFNRFLHNQQTHLLRWDFTKPYPRLGEKIGK